MKWMIDFAGHILCQLETDGKQVRVIHAISGHGDKLYPDGIDVQCLDESPKAEEEQWITDRTKAISEMLDNPYNTGIYPTSECFDKLDRAAKQYASIVSAAKDQRIAEVESDIKHLNDLLNSSLKEKEGLEKENEELHEIVKSLNRRDE